jgi:hypothetical protein
VSGPAISGLWQRVVDEARRARRSMGCYGELSWSGRCAGVGGMLCLCGELSREWLVMAVWVGG